MWQIVWRQWVWPNLVRPWLTTRALKLSTADATLIAAAIELRRESGPVSPEVVSAVWTDLAAQPIIHALEQL